MPGPIQEFLRGQGHDGRGRLLAEVLAFEDAEIESGSRFHPVALPAARAEPGGGGRAGSGRGRGRGDPRRPARAGRFSRRAGAHEALLCCDRWLADRVRPQSLRITRIIAAVRDLLGREEAAAFHAFVTERNRAAGGPVNAASLRYWQQALG